MSRNRLCRPAPIALAVALALHAGVSNAQESAPTGVEEIVVTGSFIRGAEQAALPIAVISSEDLEKRGSPTMLELLKSIPSIQSTMGDANQFTGGYALGSASINLRGLSSARNLVLLNGKRLSPNPSTGIGVDANLLPMAAIGRVDVLKDGAAATYGSDAITGVVNFVTRTDLEGFVVDGSYTYVDGSDGEYSANVAYGWKGDSTDVLLTAGYRHRSELPLTERDEWALRTYRENPSGGWTASGNPGTFRAGPAVGGTTIVDPQCENLGGVFTTATGGAGTPATIANATGCSTQYTALDNLVEDEDHYQVFGQLRQQLDDSMELSLEGLYAVHEATENSSPSYLPTQGPNGISNAGVNSSYTVPLANPGFAGLLPQLTQAQRTAIQNAGGVTITSWRPYLVGGHSLTGGAKHDTRDYELFRFSLGLSGEIGESARWESSVTYSETNHEAHTPDPYVARLQLALNGLGGPNCNGVQGGTGCLWLNPFSTALSENVITGQRPTVAPTAPNSPELARWLYGDFGYEQTQRVLAIDSGWSGDTGLALPGGNVAWAAGAQFRQNGVTRDPVRDADVALNPCAQSIINPATTCIIQTGVLSFNSPLTQYNFKQDVLAAYGELRLPIFDSLNAQIAVRYEDYGSGIGDTTNPKLALHWQPLDALAFRGSIGTTFRAPTATQTISGLLNTGNAFVTQILRYLPFDTHGNPNLKPEEALTFSVGMIANIGGFSGSVDFWSIELEDAIVPDSGTDIVTRFFAGVGNTVTPPTCSDPAFAGLRSRFTFNSGAACGPLSDLGRVRITTSNAQKFDLSGIDADLRYSFDVLGGRVMLGVEGTYNLKYQIGAIVVEGVQIQPSGDYIGTRGSAGNALPEWKAAAFVEYSAGNHNVRWTARHTDEMYDIRTVTTRASFASFLAGDPGSTVDAYTAHDVTYRVVLPWDTVATATVTNVFDEDPSFARLDLNYDPFMGNPIGRTFKVGFSKSFQ